jgi:hypothetical protein
MLVASSVHACLKESAMATAEDILRKWESMDGPAREEFIVRYGGDPGTKGIEYYIEDLTHNPEREGKLCLLLGLPTEAEKSVQATVEAAGAAKTSAENAGYAL